MKHNLYFLIFFVSVFFVNEAFGQQLKKMESHVKNSIYPEEYNSGNRMIESKQNEMKDNLFNNESIKNFLFCEAGGNGIFLSINYERLLTENVGIRIGAGSFGYSGLSFPIMFNYYLFEKHKLELGLGIIPFSKLEENDFIGKEGTLLSFTIGLKSYKKIAGLMFRVSLTPFVNLTGGNVNLFGGLSFGWAFN